MRRFHSVESFSRNSSYDLLPFRFISLDGDSYVLTNLGGEYLIAPREKLAALIKHQLSHEDPLYVDLRSRHFLSDEHSSVAPELLAMKLRTRYERLAQF